MPHAPSPLSPRWPLIGDRRPSAWWLLALGLILAIFGTLVGRFWPFTVDDAGISYAYARNVALGHGLVLTPGAERVEAATNLLWCLLLAPARWLGGDHELLSKVLGLAGGTGALVALGLFPAIAYRRRPAWYDLLAPLATALLPNYALWSVAGLETGLFAGLAALSLLLLALEEDDATRVPFSAVSLFLLFMTRPDGALYGIVAGLAKTWRFARGDRRRQDALWVGTLIVLVAALELFRLEYFAWPVPNSFYTKKRTFDFGKDLWDVHSAGWQYVRNWLAGYHWERLVFLTPLTLLALRATATRLAVVLFAGVALGFPVYSHGDWMEEFRFCALGAPVVVLGMAEGARAVSRWFPPLFPPRMQPTSYLVFKVLAGALLLWQFTAHVPAHLRAAPHHETLEFEPVRARARYFVAAAKLLGLDARPGLLDPDVGGSSYDGRLDVVDLFGLGDIPIAHTHPENPPGSRAAIFHERRPTFVHLHGAWFGAMELTRLEEMEQGYLHVPETLPTGEKAWETNFVRREDLAAPWLAQADALAVPHGATDTAIDGVTMSHHALEPGAQALVELALEGTQTDAGVIELVRTSDQRRQTVPVLVAGGVFALRDFVPGERPRARVTLSPEPGTWHLTWRGPTGVRAALGDLAVAPGAAGTESKRLRDALQAAVKSHAEADALALARTLRLRVAADPGDAQASQGLAAYAASLAADAQTLAGQGALDVASALAREAVRWAPEDRATRTAASVVGAALDAEGQAAAKRGDAEVAFARFRDAVLVDPTRSWSRRRAEEWRPHAVGDYDGATDTQAYRFAAAALATPGDAVLLDRAVRFLGHAGRFAEAAALTERAGGVGRLTSAAAQVVVARGLAARGHLRASAAVAARVPCGRARDPALTRALRALRLGASDAACALSDDAVSWWDARDASFESGSWGAWHAEGTAFGAGPAHTRADGQQFTNGWHGWSYANSFAQGSDNDTGSLRSPAFVLSGEGVSFLVGGGSDTRKVGVRLWVDGQKVLEAAAHDREGLQRVWWDVRAFAGHLAMFEVYDQSGGSWAHILADDFRVEPVVPPQLSAVAQPPAPSRPTPATGLNRDLRAR